jgi:hypothetical protein
MRLKMAVIPVLDIENSGLFLEFLKTTRKQLFLRTAVYAGCQRIIGRL